MAWCEGGERHEGRVTVDNLRRAMDAIGLEGWFTVYEARTGTAFLVNHAIGTTYLKNAERGFGVGGGQR